MTGHDLILDYIGTPQGLIRCDAVYERPQGIAWEELGEKLDEVPILRYLAERATR
jgi:hypothetical protein